MSSNAKLSLILPDAVIDWMDSRPTFFPSETALEVLLSLAQCIVFENDYDIENLVDVHNDVLLEEASFNKHPDEEVDYNHYEYFFRDMYLPANALLDSLDLRERDMEDDYIKMRFNVNRVTPNLHYAVVTLSDRVPSDLYRGEFRYLKYEV